MLIKYILPLLLFISISLKAQFNRIETNDLDLIYIGESHSYLVNHTIRCFENSLRFHEKLFNYKPSEKVIMFLHDFSDYGNAGASASPHNRIAMSIAPFSFAYETVPGNERMNNTLHHELVHIVTNDQSTSRDRFFRNIFFGKVHPSAENPLSMIYGYLTVPKRYAPRWYQEGIAVFIETWMTGGLGRAMGSFDEMVFRTLVAENAEIYDLLGLESAGTKIDFQVGVNSYLYGTRFMSYVALKYGPEKLIMWTSRTEGSGTDFVSNFSHVFNASIYDTWDEWISFEKEFQQSNLELIKKNPTTKLRKITSTALGSVSRPFIDAPANKLYLAVNYRGVVPHLAEIDLTTGESRKIIDIKGAALYYVSSIVFNPYDRKIYYTTDNDEWRDIISVNVDTGEKETMLKEERIGDLAFNKADSSLWGIRHYNGISTLVRIPKPYNRWKQIYSFPYGEDIYDIDVSPDGKLISSGIADITGNQKLIFMEIDSLMNGIKKFNAIFDFENSIPANFTFSEDGNSLYGASYYSGVSNIYRYDINKNDMSILTNTETGLFRPIEFGSDSLLAFNFTSDGFEPVVFENKNAENVNAVNFLGQEIVEKYPVLKDWIAPSPATIDLDTIKTFEGKYNGFASIGISSIYPIVEGYKDFAAFGFRMDLADPAQIHQFSLTATYSPNELIPENERLHLGFNYEYGNWSLFSGLNQAYFYDLFGPQKSSRKGYEVGFAYNKSLISDSPLKVGYSLNSSWYGNLYTIPGYQNVLASFSEYLSFGGKYYYQYMTASLGAIDYEKGYKLEFISRNNYVNRHLIPRIYTNLNYGFPLLFKNSSLWLRSSIGYSFGKSNEPFANFYFGSFGNNYVDYSHQKQFRNYYTFPGSGINVIKSTNFVKLLAEWILPPLRFTGAGISEVYIPWVSPTIFGSYLGVNLNKDVNNDNYFNFGSQLDFKIIIMSNLDVTFSAGYGISYKNNKYLSDELMFSLKIL